MSTDPLVLPRTIYERRLANAMLSGAPFKQLHHLWDSRFDRAARRPDLEPVAHALKRGVVKGEDEMPPFPKGIGAVMRMNGVHLLEAPDP
jgi:hypothetical protein